VLLAQINCTALIMALETHFGRVQIFGSELAFAKYCQKATRSALRPPEDISNR
jgi:hypothetical protein